MGGVLLRGDSHVEGLAPRAAEVARAFGREFDASYERGLRAADAAQWVAAEVARVRPEEVWIQLGTNDLEPPHEFADAAERVAAAVPADVACYWWLPPPATRAPYGEAARVNADVLVDLRQRGGFVGTVDSRRYAPPPGPDGVHRDAAAYRAWAERAATDSCLRAVELHGAPVPLMVALAEAESRFDFGAQNDRSGATGLFQVTGILLVERERLTGDRFALRDMLDPAKAADVAGWYVRRILTRLSEVGLPEDLGSADYVGVVAVAYNAGLSAAGAAVRSLLSRGEPVTPRAVAALTPFPERTFYEQVLAAYFPGGAPTREAPAPGAPESAPGRRRGGGGAVAVALFGGLGILVLAGKRKK